MNYVPPKPWRLYEPTDAEKVATYHRQQEERIGKSMDLPNLMERPVLISLVREVDGEITKVIYVEAEAEVCGLGEGKIPAEEWEEVSESLAEFLRGRGIRIVRAFVPENFLEIKRNKKKRSSPLVGILNRIGFTRETGPIVQFFRWLI